MKVEIIEKIAAGLRKAGGDKPLLIVTTDYKYSGDNEVCGIKMVYNPLLGFSEQDSRDCPFIPLYENMKEDYDSRAFYFRKGYEEH